MFLEFIIAIVIIRYLRKNLQTKILLPQWDKILWGGMIASVILLVLEAAVSASRPIAQWLSYVILFGLVYLLFSRQEFRPVKPILYAVLPLIIVLFISSLAEAINVDFKNKWGNYFDTATLFAGIWLVAMLLISNKQKKTLEIERQKTLEKAKQVKETELLKAALEVQVAERTVELTKQKEGLQKTLQELKATQDQLIQSEKMASLGELTAGIAHEIQNPLNFVNNFSEINTELIAELKEEIAKGNFDDVKAIADSIAENEQKINQHGKRADSIVKGMLQHSRSSSATKELTDINKLADEYLRLAYHGLRAKDKTFNATIKTDYDESIRGINIVPQDMGRAILNIITNAFYAITDRKKQSAEGYEPVIFLTTRKLTGKVEIKIKDNGNGIPQQVLGKIFQPFFTTKPAGQGTGLGLSLSYDIAKAHGGELKVETWSAKDKHGTEFTISLPV